MNTPKKGIAIFLIVLGSVVTLFGGVLTIATFGMILEGQDLISTFILLLLFLLITAGLGAVPLVKGIRRLQGKGNPAKKSVEQEVNAEAKNEVLVESASEPKILKKGPQILCRDEQFDNGDWPLVKALLKAVLYTLLPLVLLIAGEVWISKSVGGYIVAGTWQAWASLLILVIGCTVAIGSLVIWARYNSVGNKFFYFILHEEEGLSIAGLDNGKLRGYIDSQTTKLEKFKSAPSPLYLLLYLLCSRNRKVARRLARMQACFLVNQKHHFIEKLLMSPDYVHFSDKIISVSKIKYFSKGCEVFYTVLTEGVQEERRQYIYRETTNYDKLLAKLKELCKEKRTGWELTEEQVKRVRKNIYRRLGILFGLSLVCVGLVFSSIHQYYESAAKAEMLQQTGAVVLSFAQSILSRRGERRAYRVVIFMVMVMGAVLIKLLSEAILVQRYTCVPVEVLKYYEKSGSLLRKLTSDYRYYATVRYNNMTVTVGLSKEMWEKREEVRPLLVLKKTLPYCLIY